jgi:predicted metal-dependent hydrolase
MTTTHFDFFSATWPPIYSIKNHPRARRVKLKISLLHGLELVLPPNYNTSHIPSVLERNKLWIERQLIKLRKHEDWLTTKSLPERINLIAMNEVWQVHYLKTESIKVKLTIGVQELTLAGNIEDKLMCKKVLKAWIKAHATPYLLSKLQNLSQTMQLSYKQGVIRNQKNMWGCCTARKIIRLNYKLAFLPEHLVNHLVMHELCHTVYLDHSRKFWRLLASFDPNWHQNNHELRHADKLVPLWIL